MTLQRFTIHVAAATLSVLLIAVGSAPAQSRPGAATGETAVARPAEPAAPAPAPSAPTPVTTSSAGSSDPATPSGGQTRSGSAGRPRRGTDGQVAGRAVPRAGGRSTGGSEVVIVPEGYGFYPWGYGGLGLGGYYGGYGFWDPWSGYDGGAGTSYYYPAPGRDEGALRIRVKPREASVYVDGYYVGHVDDFDGLLQKLHLSAGPHRIELRDQRYESLFFDVNIEPDQTITYRGEMQKTR